MSITVTLTPATRSGICSLPLAALATESVTFTGADLSDGVIVTVMQPDGTPVAIGSVASGAVELNLNTKEAHRATSCVAVGESVKAFLVIGDTDALRFTVPIKLVRNYLDNVIPPTATVPVYPTQEELDAILVEIDRIQGLAADQLEEASRLDASMQETVTNFNAAVTAADAMLQRVVTEGVEDIDGAVAAGKTEIDGAKNAAVEAVGNAQTTAVKAVTDKATAVSGVLDGKVTAAQNAATAAAGSASAASQSASAAAGSATAASKSAAAADASYKATLAIQEALGPAPWKSVYDIASVTGADIILDATKRYYSTELNDGTYAFAFDTSALSLVDQYVEFRLRIKVGRIAKPTIIFPLNVAFHNEPKFYQNSDHIISFVSVDQGATWLANVVSANRKDSTAYIQDGLIHQYDAIDNIARGEHSSATAIWYDLVGGANLRLFAGDSTIDDISTATYYAWSADSFDVVAEPTARYSGWRGTVSDAIKNATEISIQSSIIKKTSAQTENNTVGFCETYNPNGLVLIREIRGSTSSVFGGATVGNTSNNSATKNRALTYKDLVARSYLNGNANGEHTYDTAPNIYASNRAILLAWKGYYNIGAFSTKSLLIYNRALTAEEIAYNAQIDLERYGI